MCGTQGAVQGCAAGSTAAAIVSHINTQQMQVAPAHLWGCISFTAGQIQFSFCMAAAVSHEHE